MQAYVAVLKALSGVLLGGVPEHRSSPFARREDAEAWAAQAVTANREAGRNVGEPRILTVMTARRQVVHEA